MLDIANYIYENPALLDLSLQGLWINDRACSSVVMILMSEGAERHRPALLSWDVVQEEIPAVDFVHKYKGLFSFK